MSGRISLDEAVELGASDSVFFSHFFFPRTVRQETPPFHRLMWDRLDGPSRLNSFMVFRGGAKTTLVRIYRAKRIAYLISRTLLAVGKSQGFAARDIEWMMRQVEFNALFREAFQLRPGKKWSTDEIEILVGPRQESVRMIALGITGSTRGINVDDYRPDLITVDDPSDEENTATKDQREKTENFILGSLVNSLAPRSESPLSKLVFMQTLLDEEDAISRCDKDLSWDSVRIPILDPAGNSAWPQRWATDELLKQKESYIARGKLSLWMREMECEAVPSEMLAFPQAKDQVRFYEVPPAPGAMAVALSVDPVPPPSERELGRGLKDKDFEAWTAVGAWKDQLTGERRLYVLDSIAEKGHSPDWSVKTFFELKHKWQAGVLKAESVNYQRTLKWILETAMSRQQEWMRIDAHVPEKRKKSYRIIDVLGDALAQGILFFHPTQSTLLEQIYRYPMVPHDDQIESLAVAVSAALEMTGGWYGTYEDVIEAEKDIPDLPDVRICP